MPDDLTPIQQWRRNNPDPRFEGRSDEEIARALYQVRGYGERGIDEGEFLNRVTGGAPAPEPQPQPENQPRMIQSGIGIAAPEPSFMDQLRGGVSNLANNQRRQDSSRLSDEEQEQWAERRSADVTRRRNRIQSDPVAPEGMNDDQFRLATGMYREQYEALPESSLERARVDRLLAEQMDAIENESPEARRARMALAGEEQAELDRIAAGERAQLTSFADTAMGVPRGGINALIATAGTAASLGEQALTAPFGFTAPEGTLGYRASQAAQGAVSDITQKDEARGRELPSQVGEAAGQMVPIARAGRIGGTLIGSGMSSDALTRDAVDNGATGSQQVIAQLGGAALGLTERFTPEAFEQAGRSFANPILRRTTSAATGSVTEGLQEGGQTIGENYIASTLAGYDPDRPAMSGVRDAIIVGSLVGGIAGSVFSAPPAQDDPVTNMDDGALLQSRQQASALRDAMWAQVRSSGGSTADAVNETGQIVTQLAALDAELERRGLDIPQSQIDPLNTDISVQDIATGQEPEVLTRQVTGAARRQAERDNKKKPPPEVAQASTQARLERELADAAPQLSGPQVSAVGQAISLPTNHLVSMGVPQKAALASNLQFVGADAADRDVETARELNQYVGPNALTSDSESLQAAQLRSTDPDVTPDQVRRETGWFYGPDGQWRAEISDESATLLLDETQFKEGNQFSQAGLPLGETRANLGDVLQHGPLFDAYPKMRNMPVRIRYSEAAQQKPDAAAGKYSYSNGAIEVEAGNLDQAKSILLHEVQHAIQHVESFAPGGSPAQFEGEVKASTGQARADIGKLRRTQVVARLKKEVEDLAFNTDFAKRLARRVTDLTLSPNALTENDGGFSIRAPEMSKLVRFIVEEGGLTQRQAMQTANYVMSETTRSSAFRNARDAAQAAYKKREPRPRSDVRNKDTEFDLYFRLTGEAEARDTEARANMDAAARNAATPAILNENPGADDYASPSPASLQITEGAPALTSPYQNEPARELFQSVSLRRGTQTLKKYGLDPDQRHKTRDVAAALEARQRDKYGEIKRGDYSPEAQKAISGWMVEEVMFEVDIAAQDPTKSAVGWYTEKFQSALDEMGAAFPELIGDMDLSLPGVAKLGSQQAARNFFTALIAVTSDGAKVRENFRYASQAYETFRTTGQINADVTFGGERNKSMRINLQNIQDGLDALGPDGMHEWLLQTDTVSNLKKAAKAEGVEFSTAYKADMLLPNAALSFGPKLGAFYANLMGDTGYLTMDRWWTRTFNRYRGTLLPQPTQQGLARFKELVTADQKLNEPASQMTDDRALALTVDYVRSYKAKKFKRGTEIEKAANTLYKAAFEQIEDQPFNASDREFMVNATRAAQQRLKRRGVDMTIADIQAVLWYYEKRLYGEMGARQTADISYEEVAQEIAQRREQDGADVRDGRSDAENAGGQRGASASLNPEDAPAAGEQGPDLDEGGRELNQESQAPRGSILIPQAGVTADQPVLIKMGEAADITTAIHEGGHYWLEHYREMAQRYEGVRPFYQQMAEAFGFSADPNQQIPTDAHEAFARGAEQYFAEGKAPAEGLQAIFEEFRNWMKAMYDALIASGQLDLNPERRAVYSQMFGTMPSPVVKPRLNRGPGSSISTPSTGATPLPASFDEELDSGETLDRMARDVARLAGFTVREGRLRSKGALGEYNTRSGVIRVKKDNDFFTVTHEIGHALAFKHRDRYRRVMAAVKGEGSLLALTNDVKTTPETMEDEAFAELARIYIEMPAWLEVNAPKALEAFNEQFGEAEPDLVAGMRELGERYRRYGNQPDAQTATSRMANQGGPNGIRGMIRGLLNNVADLTKAQGMGAAADAVYTATFDKTTPIARFMERMDQIYEDRTGRRMDVLPSKDARILSRLAANGSNAARVWMMEGVIPAGKIDPEGPSLAGALELALGEKVFTEWSTGKMNEFGAYLANRRLQDEWARANRGELKRKPDLASEAQVRQTIKDLEFRNPTFRDAAEMVFEWNDNILNLMRDRGLITQEQHTKFRQAHPHYVPLQRDVKDGGGRGNDGTNRSSLIKPFKGSDRDIINPIESMMQHANQLAQTIWRNETIGAMYDAAQLAGPGAGSFLEEVPANEMDVQRVDLDEAYRAAAKAANVGERDVAMVLDAMNAQLDGQMHATLYRSKESPARGEPMIYLWRNGERKMLRLADAEEGKRLYQAITSVGVGEQSHMLLDWLTLPQQFLVGAVTNHPLFVIMNWQRDQLATWSLSDNGFVPGLSGIAGTTKAAAGGVTENRAVAFGGTMAGVNASIQRRNTGDQNSWQGFNKNARLDINDLRKKGYKIRELASWRGIGAALDITESGTRFENASLYFKKAKKAGMSDEDAILFAMFEANDTMDFSRRGQVFYWMNRFIPFWNAAMQGTEKGFRVLTGGKATRQVHRVMRPLFMGKPANFTASEKRDAARALKAWGKLSIMTLPSLAMMLMYHDDPEFQEFSEYIRATRWLFKVGDEWIVIPKPFELATPANILERALEARFYEDPTAWERAQRSLMYTVMPPMSSPVVTVSAEMTANQDFYTGRPIVPDELVGERPEMQATERTAAYARLLGQTFGVSPLKIEHVVNSFTGNWARDISLASDLFDPDSPERKLSEQFFIRGLFRNPQHGAVTRDDFWNQMSRTGGRLQAVATQYRSFADEGDAAGGINYLRSLDPVEARFALSQVHGVNRGGLPQTFAQSHPMRLAQKAMTMNGGVRRDLRNDELTRLGTRNRIELTPRERARAIAILDRLNGIEALEALRMSGFEAYQNRPGFDREGQMELLRSISPDLAREYETRRRSALGMVYSNPDNVSRIWGRAEKRIDEMLSDPDDLQRLIRAREARGLMSEMPG